jgi:hypothetical protein
MTELEEKCLYKANKLIQNGFSNLDLFDLTDLLIKLETEKNEKNILTDKNIDYNDEIVSIEECGIKETIDISVSGDNLFYCNNILTKNSFGLPATADMMFALIRSDELDNLGQIMVKQLKNRYCDLTMNKRFVVGIDRPKMRLYDVEQKAQDDILDGGKEEEYNDEEERKSTLKDKFGGFKF